MTVMDAQPDVRTAAALGRVIRPQESVRPRSSFRDVMAHLAAPVSVITTSDDGVLGGATVSAVMSLSMAPEMLVVALSRESATLDVIRRTRRFGVNILAADQEAVAMHFARKGADKFAEVEHFLESGLPRLAGVSGWVRCRVEQVHPGGDHVLVSGLVEATHHMADRAPMTYHARTFGTHAS